MCEATVYLIEGGQEKKIMQDVVLLEPEGDQVRLIDLMGEQMLVRGRIKKADFLRHRVTLEELPTAADT